MSVISSPATREGGKLAWLWSHLANGGWVAFIALTAAAGVFSAKLFPARSEKLDEIVAESTRTPKTQQAIPDGQPGGYDAVWLHDRGTALEKEGREFFIATQCKLDFVFPLVYGLWFAVWIAWTWEYVRVNRSGPHRPQNEVRWLLLFPLLAVVFDLGENLTVMLVWSDFPNNWSSSTATAAGHFTHMKWFSCYVCTVLSVVGSVWAIRVRLKKCHLPGGGGS